MTGLTESERICYRCGNPAAGFASSWSPETGERWYCHGDDDETPTCYESHSWPREDGLMILDLLDAARTARQEPQNGALGGSGGSAGGTGPDQGLGAAEGEI